MKLKTLIATIIIHFFISCSTSFELIGETRQPIPREQVLEYILIPKSAKIIGNFSVSLASNYGGAETQWEIVRKAAKVGANGYKILETDKFGGGGFGQPGGSFYTCKAVLFYVPEDNEK